MILFVCYSGVLGGAERLLVEFAAGLPGERCVGCPEGVLAESARRAGLRVFPLRERTLHVRMTARDRVLSPWRLAGHAADVRGLVRSLRPDVLVAWGMRSALACVLAPGPRPPVVFQHNDLLPGPHIGIAVRAAAARADRVMTLSNAIAEDLDPRGRLAGRLTVVHPGIEVDGSSGEPPDGPPEVLVLGALVAWKRPDVALEAFALARRKRPDLRLRLVGAPLERGEDLLARLRERARRPDLAGAVEFAGAIDDPRVALARASCLLHCAEREPFGMAVLEALAAGRPAIVPASAGPAEIVDESSGFLYPPGDARAAADAILELVASPERAARMGAAGRERARDRFDRATAHRRYAAAVAPLVHKRPMDPDPRHDRVALVTVSHNSAEELRALLASVERHVPGVRVVVVDSASSDQSLTVARSWSGDAQVVALAENVGLGRACNRALLEVREPVTVLVNPDVELLDDSLLQLAAEAARRDLPERLLAPLVLLPDGSRQDSAHPVPGSVADLVRAVVPPGLLPGRAAVSLAPWRAARPRCVGWAVGCALVARTDTLRRLGPFDEQIFLYGEDLDLGLRAAAAGVATWFWPGARVLHHRAHTTRAAFGGEPFELLARTRHEVVARRLGARRARLDDVSQAATFASRAALKRLAGRSAERERRQLAALALVRGGR